MPTGSRILVERACYHFNLYGFCLMPNHVHLVGEPQIKANLCKFMQKLSRSYTAYFNMRYGKVGHLWQGRYKSKVIAKDGYLIDCIQYAERNPVRAEIARAAADYPWSSYGERVLGKTIYSRRMLDILTFF